MEENPLLELLAKKLFKNVKRRRLTEEEKRRLINVTDEIQKQLELLHANKEDDNKEKARQDKSKNTRRHMTWRRNH